ncbi:MAG: M48 family metallopeptidase [Clostridiales bacterium]|nr:M48 family metallopeptidase [Clostridiales bacterium]
MKSQTQVPPYKLIRSRRRTLSLQAKNGGLIVRAPLRLPQSEVERFIEAHRGWIEKRFAEQAAKERARAAFEANTDPKEYARQTAEHKARAKRELPARAQEWAHLMGITPASVRVGSARTRWGSCNAAGAIRLSWRLILADKEAIDYVIVHELAHLRQMNHGEAFWAIVARYAPDYKAQRVKLRALQRRLEIEGR